MNLGVCYYPEQWPEHMWADDARRMRDMGLTHVRIGEFAWSCIEPDPGRFDWGWYDRAVETLAAAGLRLILGTPTATPPKWLIDRSPDILAWDEAERPRRFGSRRHYCFSSPVYREEAARITAAVAERYGDHPAVTAWQIDNEYGCHDTVVSYSPAAAAEFRGWLERRYGSIAALNEAWGTTFWSQIYRSFAEVDPPNLTVTEANPAHRLDFQRYSSDAVADFHREQAAIVRELSPGRDVMHNFMGFFTGFDHHAVGRNCDVAGWDSYPLGFLDQGWDPGPVKRAYMRQGHPDFAACHHDLYRGAGRGRMWVIEQQPGPVNWAPNNPAPLPGMVRLWTLEAFAHGAELVSYFRWRQAPFGQEQMHAGLLRPDSQETATAAEVRDAWADLQLLGQVEKRRAPVVLIFSYEAQWLLGIQPQGSGYDPLRVTFEFYSGLRKVGVDIDILPPDADLTGYRLIVAPVLPIVPPDLAAAMGMSGARLLFGPRSGSKTRDFQVPAALPPGPLQQLIPLQVARVESLPPGHSEPLASGPGAVHTWLEHVETSLKACAATRSGHGIWYRHEQCDYLAGLPDEAMLQSLLTEVLGASGVAATRLPEGLRLSRRGDLTLAFNYAATPVELPPELTGGAPLILGQPSLAPAGVTAWRISAAASPPA